MSTRTVAVVGAGTWGKNLVRTFHGLDALAAVAEASAPLREKVRTEYPSVPVHEDFREVLNSDIPAVAIATPVPTHYSLAKEALESGKDVFVEKPLTLSTSQAEELHRIARERGKVLMVGHLLLYQPAIRWIAQFLKEGGLGKLKSLHQERLNLGRARSVENVLWSLGVHDVAVLLNLVGERPTDLSITGQRVLQETVEDDIYLHLKFSSGVQAHLHNSWLWPERRRRLTVVGTRGMLVYDELEQTVTHHRKSIDSTLKNVDEGSDVVFRQEGEPLRLELEHFLARLKDRQAPLSDGGNGLEVVAVLEQATRLLEATWRT